MFFHFVLDQVRIHKFLEKTKKKSPKEKEVDKIVKAEDSDIAKEQQRLRKKVTDLMKKQKLRQVRHIVKKQDSTRPWGQDAHAKVCIFLVYGVLDVLLLQLMIFLYHLLLFYRLVAV